MTSVRDMEPREVIRGLMRGERASCKLGYDAENAALAAATFATGEDPELLKAYAEGFATGMTASGEPEEWPYPLGSDRQLAYVDGFGDGEMEDRRQIHPASGPDSEDAMEVCGCGATTVKECCAAVEGYFRSLGERSDFQLAELVEDDCQAARTLLARRRRGES